MIWIHGVLIEVQFQNIRKVPTNDGIFWGNPPISQLWGFPNISSGPFWENPIMYVFWVSHIKQYWAILTRFSFKHYMIRLILAENKIGCASSHFIPHNINFSNKVEGFNVNKVENPCVYLYIFNLIDNSVYVLYALYSSTVFD
jgi:hypothetical protein